MSIIDARDVGDVAAAVLLAPEKYRSGRLLDLTGPSAERIDMAVETGLGPDRRVAIEPKPLGDGPFAKFMGALAAYDTVEPTVEDILGRPGRSLRDFVEEFKGEWAREL